MGKLPVRARIYVASVIAAGVCLVILSLPFHFKRPGLFVSLLVVSALASALKINLPLSKSWSTMSVSYAVDLTALLVLGPENTMLIAITSAFIQCSYRTAVRNPLYSTFFSMATLVVTVRASGLVYGWLGGPQAPLNPIDLPRPLIGAAIVYYLINTGLVAAAIALSTRQPLPRVWNDNFLWSAPSYFVGAGAAALAAVVIDRSGYWFVPLAAAPIYLSYRTYKVYLGRIEDEHRHVEKISELHRAAMDALAMAKRSEQIAAAEKEQLAVTLRSIGDGVITTDVDGNIMLLNQVAEVLTGWSQEEAAGRPLTTVLHIIDRQTRDRCETPVGEVMQTGRAVARALPRSLVGRDGTERYIENSGAPICDRDGAIIGVVLVFRDVTDTIKMEDERLKASKLESLGILAGGIAHDFNNILTAIVGNIALARMNASDPGSATRLEEAEEACLRAQALTYQLLTFSKGGAPVRKPIAVSDLLRDSARFALRGSNVSSQFTSPPDLWAVEADEGQVNQVINNIVINAKQAMPTGGMVRIRCENVDLQEQPDPRIPVAEGQFVRISVQDDGVGIAPDNLPKVFDPYFSTKKQGSGLGLATSHSIVKNHDGYMTVESEVDVGTTFHVYLPRSTKPVPVTVPGAEQRPAFGRGRILVMDDEEMIRSVTEQMLSRLGYEVELVENGNEAIDSFEAARAAGRAFDAVIMDLTIPGGMGGKEAIGRLVEIDPDVKAIVSSGYADDPVMAEFRKYGFSGVVAKPFSVRELGKALQELLAAARDASGHSPVVH